MKRFAQTVFLLAGVLGIPATFAQSQGVTLHGRISTDKESPKIQLLLQSRERKNLPEIQAEPDSDGNYTFPALTDDEYRLVAIVDGKKQEDRKIEVLCRDGSTILKDFHFGKSESTLVLHYPAEDPDTVDIAQIQGDFPREVRDEFERAHRDYSGGNLRRAIERLEALADRVPRYYKTHALLGLAYQDSGCIEDAEAEYRVASDLSPRAVHPLLNLASAQLRSSDIPGHRHESLSMALVTLEKAAQIRPNSALVFCLMGSAQSKTEAPEDAEKSFQRALEIEPSLGIARLMLGNLYRRQRNWTAAAQQFRTYLDDEPFGENRSIVREMLADTERRQ